MKLYIVRHGQTEWNTLKKMQGFADIPLNEHGLKEAQQTKLNLKNTKFDLIFCSPLTRAKQTAEIINQDRSLSIIFDDRLKERDYGEFEGTNKTSFNYNDFWSYGKNLEYSRAENVQVFFSRVYDFLDDIKIKYSDKNILIVCHGGVLKAIECYANKMMKDEDIGPFLPSNASILEYEITTSAPSPTSGTNPPSPQNS